MKIRFLALVLISTLVLSSCSMSPEEAATSEAIDSSNSTSENSSDPAESMSTDPVYVLERYTGIASRSCQKALDAGVVEQSSDGLVKLIMVSKDQAYLGYSAVYIEKFGDQAADQYVELLYDVSYFSSCTDFFDMELAKEVGAEFDYVDIKEDIANAFYEVTREFDGEPYTMKYEVIGGLIVSSERVIEDAIKLTISYGTSSAEMALLTEAVDDYLLSE